jgi:hypothetical protein
VLGRVRRAVLVAAVEIGEIAGLLSRDDVPGVLVVAGADDPVLALFVDLSHDAVSVDHVVERSSLAFGIAPRRRRAARGGS